MHVWICSLYSGFLPQYKNTAVRLIEFLPADIIFSLLDGDSLQLKFKKRNSRVVDVCCFSKDWRKYLDNMKYGRKKMQEKKSNWKKPQDFLTLVHGFCTFSHKFSTFHLLDIPVFCVCLKWKFLFILFFFPGPYFF